MKRLPKAYVTLVRQLISYGIFGLISSGLDFAVFQLLIGFTPINRYAANFISVNCGIACSFLLNSAITFKMTDERLKRAVKFFAVGYCGMVVSMLIIYIGTDALRIKESFVKLGSIVIVALFQFAMNKLITFREKG